MTDDPPPILAFRALLELNGKTATGIEVPETVVAALGAGKRPKVRATVNGYTYRTSVAPMGGRFLLPVNAEVRSAAGLAAGDAVDIALEADTEVREIVVPADLAEALDVDAQVRLFFDGLAYSVKQRYVLPIEGAKTDETRRRRIAKAVSDLQATMPP